MLKRMRSRAIITSGSGAIGLNGQQATSFRNADSYRGRTHASDRASGFIGIQCHTGNVVFRDIRVKRLAARASTELGEATAAAGIKSTG